MKFIQLKEEHLEKVLYWRTQQWVTEHMFTDIEYDMEQQRRWFKRVSEDSTQQYWIISIKDRHVGIVSINDINYVHRRCSWAFYIGEKDVSMLSMLLAPYVYQYVFDVLNFNKITGEVMEDNDAVRKMHLHYGCRESGCFQQHIYKYGKFHNVYTYELLRQEWMASKSRYGKKIMVIEE
ncbi:UDP-4-amino-4,6-dideoxy-N-acetyl-beta-L-altrosamine N-acetyltransferase [Paenibacillus hunanensis]|uniref:UDP-4-amino-4, 6-dideoxy-N-acetyl-beta-L-altrosamine N-acetyltransferase n=1 Tax=Paenibacillus hunanensis TaxID=539262 RepID=UPI002026E4CF|nr:UDP-4-amino-4,6-dideoxy-N-acetyl-beta-L-altrosamine N-acetyltransferase [Paenibacillus hunanensis]MCL9662765.1 UDP-4-amino-4,6-dideoxy-N-acetyl-beta-L-altrosamine N-acetyltransferase [Paenibacillus hunanensis]